MGIEIKRETVKFYETSKDGKKYIKGVFLKHFFFESDKLELDKICKVGIKDKNLVIYTDNDNKAEKIFSKILTKGFSELRSSIDNKKTIYVHRNSGIPLIGNIGFGIVDRGTNIIEVKPITGCNIECIYCSVDDKKRNIHFLVEKDYIVQELQKILEYKGVEGIEVHIGTQGEPSLYDDILLLIEDIRKITQVSDISIDTNGTMLTETKIDMLAKAGLTRINLSLNSLDKEKAKMIAGVSSYDITKIKKIAEHISKKMDMIIAPVWIPGINDEDIEDIVVFAKKISEKNKTHKIIMGIQNFMNYRFGKNPTKAKTWEEFEGFLKKLEKKHKVRLLLDFKEDFRIIPTKELPKQLKKGDIVKANVICDGRLNNEKLAVLRGKEELLGQRTITVADAENTAENSQIKVKMTRTKHNILYGVKI